MRTWVHPDTGDEGFGEGLRREIIIKTLSWRELEKECTALTPSMVYRQPNKLTGVLYIYDRVVSLSAVLGRPLRLRHSLLFIVGDELRVATPGPMARGQELLYTWVVGDIWPARPRAPICRARCMCCLSTSDESVWFTVTCSTYVGCSYILHPEFGRMGAQGHEIPCA